MARRSLGELELLVLLAVVRLGEDRAYAVSIAEEIHERTGRSIQRATVYVTLQRLEQKGLVSTRLGDPLPERGGKARRYVRVEGPGLGALDDTRRVLSSMWNGLDLATESLS
ncbi:MAG: helix-turn-helix transcriptional regulator [Acidobacteriota bacterium]